MVATIRARERVHFRSLDGCRAVASLAVVVVHVALLSGYATRHADGVGAFLARADVGVSIFFVLSGFLLYRPFVAARLDGRSTTDLASYARRRVLRIFPAYWFALIVVAFVLKAPGFEDPHKFWPHFLLLHVYDSEQLVGGPIQQSWSLATELGFYAFLPFYAWLVGRTPREPRRQLRAEVIGVASLWIGSTLLKVITLALGASHARFGQLSSWFPYRLDEFSLGLGLAVASAWVARRAEPLAWLSRRSTLLASWAVGALLFIALCTLIDLPIFPLFTGKENFLVRIVYSFCGLLFVGPVVFAPEDTGPARRLLGNRLMIWLGLVSYGIYIWHEAAQDLYLRWTDAPIFGTSPISMGVVTLVLTIPAAAVSWYLVERPAMKLRKRPPVDRSARAEEARKSEPTASR